MVLRCKSFFFAKFQFPGQFINQHVIEHYYCSFAQGEKSFPLQTAVKTKINEIFYEAKF